MRVVEFLVGSVVEAWGEFRTHRARVILSLIGVALAVLALTGVAAIGAVAQQAVTESLERSSGRPALLTVSPAYRPTDTGPTPSTSTFDVATRAEAEFDRYGIDYSSRTTYVSGALAGPEGAVPFNGQAVDVDYGTMHRVRTVAGEWFRPGDDHRLAPAIIVDSVFWKSLGSPDLSTHPTVRIVAPAATTAVIVGVSPGGYAGNPSVFLLYDPFVALAAGSATPVDPQSVQVEAWVPPSHATALSKRLSRDLSLQAGDGWKVDVSRNDYAAYQGDDPLLLFKVVVGAAAGLILVLGALGLVNISMVTVSSRVREIGIRRSFGSTAARVFVGVMLESVVATVAAGFVGVILAILALKNPWVTGWLRDNAGLEDVPAFPVSAALFGLLVAAGIGALAGLLPALVAVRVRPIDAIRY